MGYENHVYLAKLAEQAERYEGNLTSIPRTMTFYQRITCRNGGEHEERCIRGSRALCRRTKPTFRCLQERHWSETCLVEDRHFN